MNLSETTLNLMRHSTGVVIAAAVLSGPAMADATPGSARGPAVVSQASIRLESALRQTNVEEPKKDDGGKKEEEKDPCPACGRG